MRFEDKMRALVFLAAVAGLTAACSNSGTGGTSSTGSGTTSTTTTGGATGATTTTGGGATTGTTTGGTTDTGTSTGGATGGTSGGNVCGIVLDAGMIGICSKAFFPDNIEVNIGDTITVINGDGVTHTVTSTDVSGDYDKVHLRSADGGWTFNTGFIGTQPDAGNNIVTIWVPTDAGIVHGVVQPYYCRVHTGMMAGNPSPTITVK
jgi:plastocyanin